MQYFTFKNEDKIPLVGLGTWKSATGEVYGAVREAIKAGYRHIDCAAAYNNEAEVGLAIKDAISDGEVKREELWVTSKLWNNMHGKVDVEVALKKTLADLQLEYLDLYLIHWAVAFKPGINLPMSPKHFLSLEEMPLAATWEGMELAVENGLTRHIGVANFSIKKLKELIANAKIKPEVNQIELHPYLQQQTMLEFCQQEGIHLTAYSPLGSKDRVAALKTKDEPDLLGDATIAEIANSIGATPAQILLAWGLKRNTSVIPKSVNPGRIKQNLEAANIELSDEVMTKITELDKHFRFVSGRFWAVPGSGYTYENIWDEGA